MPGKMWRAQEEAELKALVEENLDLDEIAAKLQKTPKAVIMKCKRLGLQLQSEGYVNTSISLPKELPSVEEAAKILAGALKASARSGLSRLDVQRLQTVANISKMYKELIVDLVNYREIENKLNMMEEQNVNLQKALKELKERSPSSAPQQVSE